MTPAAATTSASATTDYVGRLAPSPTGALHLGNARSFLVAWLRARSRGGRLVMRMEDLDHPKVKAKTIQQAYDDLHWLGLDWDEGPPDSAPLTPATDRGPYVQSRRLDLYRAAWERLRAAGRIYPCVCTRRDVLEAQSAPHASDELRYPNTCRDRFVDAADARRQCGRDPAWRFRVDAAESSFVDAFRGRDASVVADWSGDFVVARGTDKPAYQLAVVVDDAAMGITEVVRGDDLLASAHRQHALYAALGLAAPTFLHLPLVVGSDGRRLAKRHGDTRLAHFREAGTRPEVVVGWLAASCGWAEPGEAIAAARLIERFTLASVPREAVAVAPADHARLAGE